MKTQGNIESVQVLRGLAAVLVVALHEQVFYADYADLTGAPAPLMSGWYNFKDFGGVGVEIFFVISGFIMSHLAAQSPNQTFWQFFSRRLTRIVPLYWLVTTFWLFWDQHQPLGFVVRSFLFLPVPGMFPLTGVGWTLNVEVFFYLVFGFVVVTFRASILGVAVVFLAIALASQHFHSYVLTFYADPIVWCFFAGLVVHKIYRDPTVLRFAPSILFVAAFLFGHALVHFDPSSERGIANLIQWGIPSTLLVLGCVALEAGGELAWLWRVRLLQAIGGASYSIYLVHSLGFADVNYYALASWSAVKHIGPDGCVVMLVAGACLAGYGVHRLVELPSIYLVRSAAKLVQRFAAGPALSSPTNPR